MDSDHPSMHEPPLAAVLPTPYAVEGTPVWKQGRLIGHVYAVEDRRKAGVYRYKAVHVEVGEVGWTALYSAATDLLRIARLG